MSVDDPDTLLAILRLVRDRTGADFSQYRPSTIERRVRNRMILVGVDSLPAYLALVGGSEQETRKLAERLTIKVSRFYRNAVTFDVLRHEVLPVVGRRGASRPVRAWSVGCGDGEEPYTLGMLLEEGDYPGAVEASDIDEHALERAREATYGLASLAELPGELAGRFLQRDDAQGIVRVCDAVRGRVRFVRHDLLAIDPPPVGDAFDIVICSNVLIYVRPEFQEPALRRLTRALVPGGVLCLGEAEWPPAALMPVLESLGQRSRVFRLKDVSTAGGLS